MPRSKEAIWKEAEPIIHDYVMTGGELLKSEIERLKDEFCKSGGTPEEFGSLKMGIFHPGYCKSM